MGPQFSPEDNAEKAANGWGKWVTAIPSVMVKLLGVPLLKGLGVAAVTGAAGYWFYNSQRGEIVAARRRLKEAYNWLVNKIWGRPAVRRRNRFRMSKRSPANNTRQQVALRAAAAAAAAAVEAAAGEPDVDG